MTAIAPLTIALAGNPNSGKTTLFNALTGARLHVGNYPGVTVDKTEGVATHDGVELRIVDLPGTYSLTAYTAEEIVARNFVIDAKPDVVVDVIDASNIERNLYLATQLLELGVPVVLAFNMSDVAAAGGCAIDTARLSELLGVPIVSTVGNKGRGLDALLDAAIAVGGEGSAAVARQRRPDYGGEIEPHVRQLTERIVEACGSSLHDRWYALKLIENDEVTAKRLTKAHPEPMAEICAEAVGLRAHIRKVCGDAAEIILADRRYGFISGACTEAVRQTVEARHLRSDRIDAVLLHRLAGLPIFAMLMYLMFHLVFTVGELPMNWLEMGFAGLRSMLNGFWPAGTDSLLRSLIVDGVVGGVGGVMIFVPNIVLLFIAIAALEDTGYMARAAFIMDRMMHKIGLHGKSFIPMLTGFGCSVPAIMATRTLENKRDRIVTMLVVPLMSCGARLPIYTLMIPAFFAKSLRAPVLWSIYVIGVLLAMVCAKVLRSTLLTGESEPFVMELPPYRAPTLKGLVVHAWEPTRMYMKKAATVILGFSILMWAITTFPRKTQFDVDYAVETATAESEFFGAAARINGLLGLPDDSAALATVFRAELDWQADEELYRSHSAALADAQAARDATILPLLIGADGPALKRFLAARDNGMGSALQSEARASAAAAVAYEQIRADMDARLEELAHLQQAELLTHTIAGRLGRAIAPAIRPLGFDWRIGTGLIGALGAKEVFVAQMGIVYAVGDSEAGYSTLRERLGADYSPLTGYCIMLFCLITAPCLATVVMTGRESGSWKWGAFQLFGLTVLAYVVTGVVYQVGRLFLL